MKKIVMGILAHVDSGKTTLSEGLLYSAGVIRKIGRVDHGDTFLDTDKMERERGITIFSKQAVLNTSTCTITLLDTPGHVDFSAETERTLSVLDYAILVISGTEGVQSHTETLWHLLKSHGIPTFIFVNKMDISSYSENALLANIRTKLDDNCINFSKTKDLDNYYEAIAMSDEDAMQSFLDSGTIDDDTIRDLILAKKIFPCFFGSALKNEGVEDFLKQIYYYVKSTSTTETFSAKVYKITQDEQGNRLTHMKITGGVLKVKDILSGTDKKGEQWEEKVNSIRIYSGTKFKTADTVEAGTVCTVAGLSKTFPGEGLGSETSIEEYSLEPVFSYSIKINDATDPTIAIAKLKKLEEEEPALSVYWDENLKEISLRLMGEIQCEVLKHVISERFGMDVDFIPGGIVYKETIADTAEGVGHFEPLRHYAEVHLLLEPAQRGAGVIFANQCREDTLSKNWQRLIMTHLAERTHKGVLTGSPITDIKITLINGRAHIKHTEGGDFRQATYRAVRQGLMKATSVLLEPWYEFVLELPTENVGRAMSDIEKMGGNFSLPETDGNNSVLKGNAPVSEMRNYQQEIMVYTKGRGHLSYRLSGYEPCVNQEEVIKDIGYDPEADIKNTPDSVFCTHGSGFPVKWYDVEKYMHIGLASEEDTEREAIPVMQKKKEEISEDELLRIFENTYGKISAPTPQKLKTKKQPQQSSPSKRKIKKFDKTYLLVDGYNVIFASEKLTKLSEYNLDAARNELIAGLCSYKCVRDYEIILVFDAYRVKGNYREVEQINGISVVYTKEAETADSYIEKTSHELSKNNNVHVATSDALEQIIIFSGGALRIPAAHLLADIEKAENEIRQLIEEYNRNN